MYKLKKDGLVRIVSTEAEAERWKGQGYTVMEQLHSEDSSDGAAADPLRYMDVDQLKAFALEKGISIGNATSQNGIYKKIREALPWNPAQTGE